MKRMMLRIAVMLLTFAFGVVADWLILRRAADNRPPTPKVEAVNPAPLESAIASVAPVTPAAIVTSLPSATPKPYFIIDYDPETFYPYGMYYLMGSKPKEFESFDGFEMEEPGYSDDAPGYITVYKLYPDGSSGGPTSVFVLVTNRRLIFATSKSSNTGIEYRFEGEFLRTDFDNVTGKDIAVLRGVLTRSKDGHTLVERKVSFSFVYRGC
jgi:hypothetical protein